MRQKLGRSAFILPAVALIFLFAVYPALQTLWLSLWTPEGVFDPIANYGAVLGQRHIIDQRGFANVRFPFGALPHTFIWIALHLPLSTLLGLVLAVLLQKVRGSGLIKSIIFLGMVIPMVVGGLVIRFMFDKDVGVVNQFLGALGLTTQTWTAYPNTALLALIFGSVWLWTGFSLVLYSSGLATIPKDYYEAARIDGANALQIFFKITFPLLKPITVVVVVMTVIWDLKIFDLVYAATLGGPGGASNILALQMWRYAFQQFNFNYAAVVAVLLFVITVIVAIPLVRRAR